MLPKKPRPERDFFLPFRLGVGFSRVFGASSSSSSSSGLRLLMADDALRASAGDATRSSRPRRRSDSEPVKPKRGSFREDVFRRAQNIRKLTLSGAPSRHASGRGLRARQA